MLSGSLPLCLQWGTHSVHMKGATYSLVRIQFMPQTQAAS